MKLVYFLLLHSITTHAAATYFTYNSDTAFFSMLASNNLTLGNSTTVTGDIGSANGLSVGASTAVNGTGYLGGGQTCSLNCSNVLGGFVLNSPQVGFSLNAWSALAAAVQALPATGSLPVFAGTTTLAPGVYTGSTFLMQNSDTITFDAQGDSAAQFVIRIGTFSASDASRFAFVNGAQPGNLLILSSNSLLLTSGTLGGAIYSSGPLTRSGGANPETLTLAGGNVQYTGTQAGPAASVPEPSSAGLLLAGVGLLALTRFRAGH